jgi:hypothetical protein
MARYVFSPWDPIRKKGDAAEDVAKTIVTRTDAWNEERRKKGKADSELYKSVYWMGDGGYVEGNVPVLDGKKITLGNSDQVYIKGHHQSGLNFISDITKQEDDRIRERNRGIRRENKRIRKENKRIQLANQHAELKKIMHRTSPMRPLDPAELTRRFCDCFEASRTFTGKIKFYNCSSGKGGGNSFAKPAAGLLRAYFPNALYIAYEDDLSQLYGNYYPDGPPTKDSEEQKPERRKLGTTTHKRAKDLQVILREEESEEDFDSTEEPPAYLVPVPDDLDALRAAAFGLNIDLNNLNFQEFHL